jgi:hypothetical protein
MNNTDNLGSRVRRQYEKHVKPHLEEFYNPDSNKKNCILEASLGMTPIVEGDFGGNQPLIASAQNLCLDLRRGSRPDDFHIVTFEGQLYKLGERTDE